jgi:prephenate dehydrogenase
MTVGIVGLGLIGGSMAKSIKLHTKHTVLAYDTAPAEIEKARLVGAIDGLLTADTLSSCEFVVIAVYPKEIIRYIQENAPHFADGALVIDCGGVKRVLCDELRDTVQGRRWHFIGGHPMAGREYSGFRYAQDDLFENASMILTPDAQIPLDRLSAAKEFFLDAGFRRVVFSTPEAHDEMIAYTSQMAHIVSSAYVCSELALKHKGFSAGSFKDLTRVARLNEQMWSELFLLNREPLLHELGGIIERLKGFRDAIADMDRPRLVELLRCGRERKELLDDI